ncbi:unnamed protein product [Didymodactylos carnosus]|uniref:Uncharacterized protein n=1 Tax=Didymodactylos carnosus TaxID=1234261 RepID=A0A815B8W0_9BILA|nr:unnamed protein product [Didymodactylos carnosus]CAF1267191.1 unnamed protein product [Didymodactylos carnosus]CAF3728885.1 unnamed protein product [Didymodactylos carnosus]CAF4051506.1 unnamed protein product [Didymodactylos carnosus]
MVAKVISLKLHDIQVKLFTSYFDFEQFTLLQSLTLNTIRLNEMEKYILPKLSTLSNMQHLAIFDHSNTLEKLEVCIHQVIFRLPKLIRCHLPYCRLSASSSSCVTNIKYLTIYFHSYNDLIQLFHISSVEYLNVYVCRDILTIDMILPSNPFQSKLRYLKIKVSHIEFDLIESLLLNLGCLEYLSFSASNLEYIDGRRWEYILSNYLPNLKKFQIDVGYRVLPKSFLDNIIGIFTTFQTQYWLEHQWYFVFDFCPMEKYFRFYSAPYKSKCYDTEMKKFQSKMPQVNGIYDKVNDLKITMSETMLDVKHLINTIGDNYWTSTVQLFQNVQTLTLLSAEVVERNCSSSANNLAIVNLNQLIIWAKLTHLSYFYRLDLLDLVLEYATNIVSLYLPDENDLFKITKCYPKIHKLGFEEGVLAVQGVEQLRLVFPNIEHLTVHIESINHIYALLPILFQKCPRLNYLDIWSDLEAFSSKSFFQFGSKILNNFIFDNNNFHLWLWCD